MTVTECWKAIDKIAGWAEYTYESDDKGGWRVRPRTTEEKSEYRQMHNDFMRQAEAQNVPGCPYDQRIAIDEEKR
jgi:hypothetical protein